MRPAYHIIVFTTTVCLLFFSACHNKKHNKQISKTDTAVTHKVIANHNTPDTLITTACAIFINPTIAQIDSMKNIGQENFYIAADDYMLAENNAEHFLDSTKTKRIYKQSIGIIGFQTSDGQVYKFNLRNFTWGLLLFNGRDAPLNADVTMIEEDYESYMKKQ